MNAADITRLLEAKHAQDVFVSECKTGSSYGQGCLRLDAWAMKKSWATPTTFGYEVKVSRNDFLRDEKWTKYLDYCSDFYFVCPSGLIQRDEVGEGAGLLWVAKTGTRLFTKKKAPRRQVEIPEELWRYILMWRTEIVADHSAYDPVAYWRKWLTEKAEKQGLGYMVKGRISEIANRLQCENRALLKRCERAEEIEAEMKRLGIDRGWNPSRDLRELFSGDTCKELRRRIERLSHDLAELAKTASEEVA